MIASAQIARDLAARVDAKGIIANADWGPYVSGWRNGNGTPQAVVAPASVDALRDVVRYCVAAGLPIVPQGANTGLVGASVPDQSGTAILLSLSRITAIRSYSAADGVVVAEAGLRLSALNDRLAADRLQLGIDLGADPTIGGMVAANTGGARMIRYGDMRRHILGVEVILADHNATLLSNLPLVRKDNSRLGWGQLVAGSGGALGIVTAASLTLDAVPQQSATVMLGISDCAALPSLITSLRGNLGEILAAVEGISGTALAVTLTQEPALRNPFGSVLPPYTLLIEAASALSPDIFDIETILFNTLQSLLEEFAEVVVDAVALPPGDAWALRHAISGALQRAGNVIGLDISVPLHAFPTFRNDAAALIAGIAPTAEMCDFGHCGDGGVHLNIVMPRIGDDDAASSQIAGDRIRAAVYEMAVALHGSFSAEHGLGPTNHAAFERHIPVGERVLTHGLRRLFDPGELVSRALPKYMS